jgi:hypothetical protein
MGYQVTRYFNSVKVHPQMGHNGHPVDGALVGAGSPSIQALGIGLSLVLVGSSGTLHWMFVPMSLGLRSFHNLRPSNILFYFLLVKNCQKSFML